MEDSRAHTTLSQHCLENQALCACAEPSTVKVNVLLIYSADLFLSEEETVNEVTDGGKEAFRGLSTCKLTYSQFLQAVIDVFHHINGAKYLMVETVS